MEPALYFLPVEIGETLHILALAHDVQHAQDLLLVLLQVFEPGAE